MKKAFLFFVASTLLSCSVQAQISFIPKGGIVITDIAADDRAEGQKAKMGLVVGAGFNLPVIEDFLSVQPEFLYIQKGTAYEADLPVVGNVKSRITVNYLEVPLLAKISFGSDAVKAYVNAGPSLGFGLGGKLETEIGNEDDEAELTFGNGDDDDFNNRFDLGAQFGGGIGFQAGPGDLLLDVRYGLGLSNLNKTEDGMTKEEAKSKHRVIALTIGYAIPFGGK